MNSPKRLTLMQNVANQMGQALDRVRLFIAAREHARECRTWQKLVPT
jgi:hypothetical protein